MAKVFGRHKLMPGFYCDISPGNGVNVKMSVDIKWYAWPFLAWKAAHQNYNIAWYYYPYLLWAIICFTVRKWIGKDG